MISAPTEGFYELRRAGRVLTLEAFRDISQAFRALVRLGYAAGTPERFTTFRATEIVPIWTDTH